MKVEKRAELNTKKKRSKMAELEEYDAESINRRRRAWHQFVISFINFSFSNQADMEGGERKELRKKKYKEKKEKSTSASGKSR